MNPRKHRPSLTPSGINHIIELVKKDLRDITLSTAMEKAALRTQAETRSILETAHTVSGVQSIEEMQEKAEIQEAQKVLETYPEIQMQMAVNKEILATLIPYLAKIEVAALQKDTAFLPGVKATLINTESTNSLGTKSAKISEKGIPKKLYWKLCYEKSIAPETMDFCTNKELQAAQEHRYVSNLMDEQEEEEFEKL